MAGLPRTHSVASKCTDDKLHRVCEKLYISSAFAASKEDNLKCATISHIVNSSAITDPCYHEAKGYKYHVVNVLDDEKEDIQKYFDDVSMFIDDALKNNGSVLVHCHGGVSRSTALCSAFLISRRGHSVQSSLNIIRAGRSIACPNAGFIQQLETYHASLGFRRRQSAIDF